MGVQGVTSRCWILALFKRDDGERLLLGDGLYEFKDSQQHFAANTFENSVVELQGSDGALLAGQVRRAAVQVFDGYVGGGTTHPTDTEEARKAFFRFFRKGHLYTVVYIFPDGSAIQRRRGYIVDAPEVQEIRQIYPEYHVALNFEDVNYYVYNEDGDGKEVFSSLAVLPYTGATSGGLVWDEDGAVWDEDGAVWEQGGGNIVTVTIDSIDNILPVWRVTGPAVNPVLENATTGETIRYSGAVTSTQTLEIDMANGTATLNGASVIQNVSGTWVSFAPGENRIAYSADNANAPASEIEWQEIVG